MYASGQTLLLHNMNRLFGGEQARKQAGGTCRHFTGVRHHVAAGEGKSLNWTGGWAVSIPCYHLKLAFKTFIAGLPLSHHFLKTKRTVYSKTEMAGWAGWLAGKHENA